MRNTGNTSACQTNRNSALPAEDHSKNCTNEYDETNPDVHPLEQYLTHLAAIRNTGAATPETSYYPPLAELLNAVGQTLKPKVRAVNQLANTGAGIPDGGLFAESQFKKRGDAEPLPGQMPERGVIEIKSPKEEVAAIADTKQITKYWQKYKLVLVTNYRDFLLVGERDDKPVTLEIYRLAESESAFWVLAAHPRKAATEQGERFADFLARCLRANAPLSDPKDVAWFLASYARDARTRIEQADLPALESIRASLEELMPICKYVHAYYRLGRYIRQTQRSQVGD